MAQKQQLHFTGNKNSQYCFLFVDRKDESLTLQSGLLDHISSASQDILTHFSRNKCKSVAL